MGWPVSSQPYNPLFRRIYDYLKKCKSEVNIALDKAKHGGKKSKAGKAGAKKEEEKPIESCCVFVALDYPDW